MTIKFNEVTWYSKLAAIIFFLLVLPALTFYIGTKYQEAVFSQYINVPTSPINISKPAGVIAENPEGEADPARMTLGMNKWTWISVLYNDGSTLKPKQPSAFTIKFNNDGTFSATTDCNQLGGKVDVSNGSIKFADMYSTKMFCEGSQETDFQKLLQNTTNYHLTSRGELVFNLKFDSGSVVFR